MVAGPQTAHTGSLPGSTGPPALNMFPSDSWCAKDICCFACDLAATCMHEAAANRNLHDHSIGCAKAHRVVVGLFLHKLRGHVERRSLDGGHQQRAAGHGARKAEVTELDAAARADEHVLRLHVTVDDSVAVQVVQRAHQLLGNAAHLLLR